MRLSTCMLCVNCKGKPSVSEKDRADLFTPSSPARCQGYNTTLSQLGQAACLLHLSQHCLQMTAVPSKLQHSVLRDPVTYSKSQEGHQEMFAPESYTLPSYRELELPRTAEKFCALIYCFSGTTVLRVALPSHILIQSITLNS